jgi:ABC-2 type transport system ATP-binding protein
MIEAEQLSMRFGPRLAVDRVSFAIERGSVVGFLGPNGAGKSTTMRMLTGYLRPTSGRARICSFEVGEQRLAAQARLGYLPEAAGGFGILTVREFLTFCGRARGIRGRALDLAIARVAAAIELAPALGQRIKLLSKGWRQRCWLAQALLHDPPVLILDEPTDGLDPGQRLVVRRLIRGLVPDKAILLSTHSLEEVEALCDRTIILCQGRIVADASTASLADASGHLEAAFHRLASEQADHAGA